MWKCAACTCILVLMTSSGVFPNTLAAPATAPNAPVMMGLMDLLGLSPGRQKTSHVTKHSLNDFIQQRAALLRTPQRDTAEVHTHTLTLVPVPEGGHDEESDRLIGSLFEDSRCEALIRPSDS